MEKNDTPIIYLSSIFTASLVAANLLGSKLFDLWGVTLSLGILVFPLTFISVDIATEVFGKARAQHMVKAGVLVQIYILAFVFVGSLIPSSSVRDIDDAYRNMFALAPRMVLASIVAYSVSQFLDVYIFAKLKQKFSGNFLLLRTNITSWIAQLVDTLIFMSIFLGGVLSFEAWCKSFAVAYISKMIVATFDSPLVNFGVWLIRRKEHKHV